MTQPTPIRSALLTLGVVLTLLMGVGCESGFRIGDWQVIDPEDHLSLTRVELTRKQTVGNGATVVVNQSLVIDLGNGRASFTDTDGQVYPQQVDAKIVAQLREQLPKLELKKLDLDEKTERDVLVYNVQAFDSDSTVKRKGAWKMPPAKPLPPVLVTLVDSFDRAFRVAHPLSDRIDLTK